MGRVTFSDKYFCDRCGKEIEPIKLCNFFKVPVKIEVASSDVIAYIGDKHIEKAKEALNTGTIEIVGSIGKKREISYLCRKCAKAFKVFMSEGGTEDDTSI